MSVTAMERAVTETVQFLRVGVYHLTDSDAKAIGPELLEMEDFTTAAAVEHVRDHPNMALHYHLIWHDYSAAELYRQNQISYFRRAVKMVRSTSDGKVLEERTFNRVARAPLADAESVAELTGTTPTAVRRLMSRLEEPPPAREMESPPVRQPAPPKERFNAEWREAAEAVVPSEEALALQAREAAILLAERFADYRIILARIDPPLGAVFRAIDRLALGASGE